jgi:hypothetical protein
MRQPEYLYEKEYLCKEPNVRIYKSFSRPIFTYRCHKNKRAEINALRKIMAKKGLTMQKGIKHQCSVQKREKRVN